MAPASTNSHEGRVLARTPWRPHDRAEEVDDRQIASEIAAAKAGRPEALSKLYEWYAHRVFNYVRTIVRDDYEAEDVTQHVFAKLMTCITKYEPRAAPFSAWILRVARNVAIDHLREQRVVPCTEVQIEAPLDEYASERRRSLTDALEDLPYDQRRVLVLRHLVGLSPGEIADRLSKSERAVHGLHHRGRSALRAALTASGAAPALGPRERRAKAEPDRALALR